MQIKKVACLAVALVGLLAGCSSTESRKEIADADSLAAEGILNGPKRPTALSRQDALARFKQISRVSYTLWFGLDEESKDFQGRAILLFDLKLKAKDVSDTLQIDLEEGTLNSLKINGKVLTDFASRFDGHHITLKLKELQPTGNRVEIAYTHPYATDGSGLHRFVDPADGKVYLYSNFEPYRAHKMFPCFDQPDLKASYTLTVEAPESWQVVSNTLEHDTTKVDGHKSWSFPPSALFSTYLFALHAGPYAVWKSDAHGIPIRLFSRKSLAKYVDHEEWFEVTRNGLDFYNLQFGIPYPFIKYDQIIVPDFNAGAMENVGAVTFSERYVYRTKVTQDRRRGRANTILHEMAHMWFGDLVTMRWWNGLWLNESFATFMAYWAVDQATRFKGSWQSFFSGIKEWAYWEDQLVTTHSIEQPVPDTSHAEASFDGITYGKGAASLKQLNFYLGEDDFREGLQRYFEKYAYRNTTIHDFIRKLAEASSKDLGKWQSQWLQTSGVNQVAVNWKCAVDPETSKSKLVEFDVVQSQQGNGDSGGQNSSENSHRMHKTRVALLHLPKGQGAALRMGKVYDVSYSTERTSVPEALNGACPDFVFPNYSDHDYAKVELDPVSLKFVSNHLAKISDPFLRQMIWHSLWEMVVDGKFQAQEYATLVRTQGSQEKDTLVLARILQNLTNHSANTSSVMKFLNESQVKPLRERFEKLVAARLQSAPAGSDLQLIWYQNFLNIASSQPSITLIRGLLTGKQKLKGFAIDQERRWDLVKALARNGASDSHDLIQHELSQDSTDLGQKYAIAAEAQMPEPETKKKWLEKILLKTPEKLPLAKLREAMRNFQILGQEGLIRESIEPYFETLPKIAMSKSIEDQDYSKWVAELMYPSLCDPEIVKRTTSLLDSYPNLPVDVIKSLKINRQEEERCIRARKKSETESEVALKTSE